MNEERLFVGPGVLDKSKAWMRGLAPSRRVMLASEPGVWRLYGADLERALRAAGFTVSRRLLPMGEAAKSWGAVEGLMTAMLDAGIGRDGAVVALGGGAVTDAAGFAAAIYLRGVPWVSAPTTLLGQIDSGLGGKTGINLAGGKNLAGAFYRPAAVVCDSSVLKSLPRRERLSGLGEALKYGLVFEPALWRLMTKNWDALMSGDERLTARVVRSGAAWKRKIVSRDLRETTGARELLNFGHTLGHALESAAGLGRIRHGEAVIWGMRAALRLSISNAGLSRSFAAQADEFLSRLPVPMPRRLDARFLLASTKRDKKARAGKARFVLLRAPGRPATMVVPDADILRVVRELS
jgi:3-dehydroquinate synthase